MKSWQLVIKSIAAIILMFLVSHQESFAQTYVDVAPGFSTLNDAIANNTDPNAVFRLQRGDNAIYLLNGTISNTTPLVIIAADGTGAMPKLIPGIGSGGVSSIPFRAKGNLTLKGLYVTAKDEGGAYLSQIIRESADNVTLNFDDCFFESTSQSFIRTDNKMAKIYIRNSTVRNCASDYANGRGIDDRGVDMDTLVVENCTIYNLGSRFLRDGGGILNYAYINHNTFVNTGLQVMQFGESPKVVFINNLVYNCGFIGHGQTATDGLLQLEPLTSTVYAGVTQSVEVNHNNFVLNPNYLKYYPDTVVAMPKYDAPMQAAVTSSGLDTTNISELVAFSWGAPTVEDLITAYWNDPLLSSSTTAVGLRVSGTYDFSYSTKAASYTAASDGKPVGALTWFDLSTGVNDHAKVPGNFSLYQNYPNPFNPTTNIKYEISKESKVELTVFNSLGQMVKSLVNTMQPVGSYSISWDVTNQSGQRMSSGVYFYKLNTGDFISVKKMIMLK